MTRVQAVLSQFKSLLAPANPPLLVTSSVHGRAPFVKLTDPGERISLTLNALGKWLALNDGLTIVICDGSNFDFSNLTNRHFPQARIECLFFDNNQEAVHEFGKGWGEGEIVKYALQNSSLLRRANFFAKCTSKIFVSNFAEILKCWNGRFLCDCNIGNPRNADKLHIKRIDTRFYIVDKALYLSKFAHAHLRVRDRENHFLEHCFRDVVLSENIERFMLPITPLYEGVSGTRAKSYPQMTADQLEKDAGRREAIGRLTNYLSR